MVMKIGKELGLNILIPRGADGFAVVGIAEEFALVDHSVEAGDGGASQGGFGFPGTSDDADGTAGGRDGVTPRSVPEFMSLSVY